MKKKNIIILTAVTVAAFALAALIFAFPNIAAKSKLNGLKKTFLSDERGDVYVSLQTAFESGTFEQMELSFEKLLNDNETEKLASLFELFTENAKYKASSASGAGMSDYRIVFYLNGERITFYVSEEGLYVTDNSLRTSFVNKENKLYDYLEELKNEYFGN